MSGAADAGGRRPQAWAPAAPLLADLEKAIADASRRTPEDRFEAWAWQALLGETGPALLTKACAPVHVTASAVVLDPGAEHTCLVLHGRLGVWVQPGGHLEPSDLSVAAAAGREVAEETGLEGSIPARPLRLSRHLAACQPGLVDWHLDIQHLMICDRVSPLVSPESRDVAWWRLDELPEPRASGVGLAVSRAVERLTGATLR